MIVTKHVVDVVTNANDEADRQVLLASRPGHSVRIRTKRETVTVALQEYIEHRKQQEILSLFGGIDYERGYDYKRERMAKRL